MNDRELILKENLNRLIKESGLTQIKLSSRVNMNNSTLHNYLNGVVPSGIIGLTKIADYFHITLDELLFGPSKGTNKPEISSFMDKYELIISIKDKHEDQRQALKEID